MLCMVRWGRGVKSKLDTWSSSFLFVTHFKPDNLQNVKSLKILINIKEVPWT